MGEFLEGNMAGGERLSARQDGPFRPAGRAVPQLGDGERRSGAERRRRVQGGAGPLPPHHLARLPLGAPHAHLPQAQRTRGHDLALGRPLAARRARLDLRGRAGRHSRSDLRRERAARVLCQGAARLQRPRHRAGAMGQEDGHDRQQRIVRDHPHVQSCLRRASARRKATIIRASSGPRSTRSTPASTRPSTTASIAPASRPHKQAYEEAFRALFETLDMLEQRLAGQRFLCGERVTEADWRLFTTLIRFDPVYFGHFKCNLREIRDYPALSRYLKRALPLAGRRRDDRLLPHQASLLREPLAHQSDRHRAAGAGTEL